METVELWRIKQLAEASREAVWDIAKAHGYEPKIYLHWSAGKYNTPLKISNLPSNIVLTSDGIIPFSLNKK